MKTSPPLVSELEVLVWGSALAIIGDDMIQNLFLSNQTELIASYVQLQPTVCLFVFSLAKDL